MKRKLLIVDDLSGLDQPTSGRLTYDGQDIYSLSDRERSALRRRSIGFVFQQFHLLLVLTVQEKILMPLLLDKKQADEAYAGDGNLIWRMATCMVTGQGFLFSNPGQKRKHLRMIDSSVGAFLSYRIMPSLCIFPM